MDIQSFFSLLLADEGTKFLAEWVPLPDHKRGGIFKHYAFDHITDMVSKAKSLSTSNKNVYFACATYKEAITKTTPKGKDYIAGRTQDNALGAKALWLDIDVGKANDNNSYSTQAEALAAIKLLCTKTGLHTPMLVSSGNGFHCYWLFDRTLPKSEWDTLATLWRMVTKDSGLKIDPSRDKDISSVLRPPETINPKGNKLVKVMKTSVPKPPSYYRAIFTEILGGRASAVIQPKLGNSLEVIVEYPPSSLEVVAQNCATIRLFRDTGSSEFEPTWRGCLGVAKHCFDGEELAHKWSAQDIRYDAEQTQAKLDLWKAGPALCASFRESSESCKGCAHTVTSPVQLGYSEVTAVVPAPAKVSNLEAKTALQEVINIHEAGPEHWPTGITVLNNRMCMMVRNEEGVTEPVQFAFPKFWPVERVRLEDGTYAMRLMMEVKQGRLREFDLPTKNIVDGRSLKVALAANEIIVLNEKLTMAYLQSYADKLRLHMEEVNTFKQYGWTPGFKSILLGDKLFTETGITTVRLAKKLQDNTDLVNMYQVSGDKQTWIDGVNTLYNREFGEPYQYAIATQFGAWLCPLMESEEWNGIPLALTSGASGLSKSTSIKIGQNAFLRSSKTTLAGSTVLGVSIRASTMGTVPVLFDEITNYITTGPQLSDVLYTLSNGRQRVGGKADGSEREPLPPFKIMSSITANKNAIQQLTESKTNPEATQLRVFEIALEEYPIMGTLREGNPLQVEHAAIAGKLLDTTYGVFAEEYFSYLIRNRDAIKKKLDSTLDRVLRAITKAGGSTNKERFYARHVACNIVALGIMITLGYVTFDIKNLISWAINHINKLRKSSKEANYSAEDKLSAMMADFMGFMLVTREYDSLDIRTGIVEEPIFPLRGTAKARIVLGSKRERGKVIIAGRALDTWCRDNNVGSQELRRELFAEGFVRTGDARPMLLAKGIPQFPMGSQRCIELDYSKMHGIVSELHNVADLPPKESQPQKEKVA